MKYARKMLPAAPSPLIYKFLRNKNIELNSKKCKGDEILKAGDLICFYLSDETYDKFHKEKHEKDAPTLNPGDILYEDDDYLFYNKAPGTVVQGDGTGRISLNDMLISYTGTSGIFRPSICNRLDTNTSGIVMCGKSISGLRILGDAIKNRRVKKIYRAILSGVIPEDSLHMVSFHRLDEKENKVIISDTPVKGAKEIITDLTVLRRMKDATYAELELVTGRKHQIRAQSAFFGYPVLGDPKYGREASGKAGPKRQLLHAATVILPEDILEGMRVEAPLPEDMENYLERH